MLYELGEWSTNEGLMFLCDKEIEKARGQPGRGIGELLEENQ
jgi:hypothetical protein